MAPSAELFARVQARAGTVLNGKWRLDAVLGVGGMAAVYSAVHRNQSRVAIKMLHPELSLDSGVRTRFLREGYVANTVDHSGAVRVFDDDVTADGAAFLVMELLLGETLEARAERKGGKLPAGDVLTVTDELLDVLAAAHDKGIVHRDIKPDNLFVTREGRLKVLDFGIARVRELSHESNAGTAAGTFLGTPAFMAPEQARGRWQEVDARSDIWAVGATMFSLLTGRNVHEATTVNEQLVLAATNRAASLAQFAPELPRSVIALVDRALCPEKAERWPSVRHMREQLREALAEVDAPRSLSAPNPWTRQAPVEREAATLAASPELISSITGASASTGSAASSAVTSAIGPSSPGSRVLPLLVIGGGLFVLGLVILAVFWGLASSRAVATTEPASSAGSPRQPAPSASVTRAPVQVRPPEIEEPQPADSGPSEELASSRRVPVSRPRLGQSPRVTPRVAAAETPGLRPAASTDTAGPRPSARPPAENPFDKRY